MADGDRIPKVLVVDDELNIRELVEVALKFHGCAVAVSASGKDALHQAGIYEPDLMILDVMLPDMDGFEVCRTLRAEGNDVPVIFLTARDTTSDTIRGLTIGGAVPAAPPGPTASWTATPNCCRWATWNWTRNTGSCAAAEPRWSSRRRSSGCWRT
jgi:CheY-like chemotaxis protein